MQGYRKVAGGRGIATVDRLRSAAMDATPRGSRSDSRDTRIALLVGCASFLFFLLLQHGHFKGSDELAVYEMSRSILESGDLAVPALRHTEVGADGRRYSYFSPGQSVLALPLFALATPLRTVLPDSWTKALAGPLNRRGAYRFGGELEATLVGLFGALSAALLVGLFFVFELDLGVSPRCAVLVALLVATSTHTAVMSAYFLRHTTEAVTLLGALLLFRRFGQSGSLETLGFGSVLASLTVLIRVPAAIAAPTLAAYLGWLLYQRGEWRAGASRLARVLAAILVPLGIALAIHMGVNEAKWGSWLSSPMVEQQSRFNSPLLRGLAGLLLSPGSSVFVYSPLLLVAPFGLAALWRRDRELAAAALALTGTWLFFYARFDGWSGLWSAPGPRYLFMLVPLLLLPLGLWLDSPRRWAGAFALAIAGFFVQVASTVVRWGSVPTLADYPLLGPDQADFLFQVSRSPVVVMTGLLASGGPIDSWLWNLWHGWEGFPGRPGAVLALLGLWTAAAALCGVELRRALRVAEGE